MSDFTTFLKLGFRHITDINGLDHILFILALCSIYKISEWRKVILLITAFTIGHTITLALATLNIIKLNTKFIEFLIPVTILITCIFNFFYKIPDRKPLKQRNFSNSRYIMALSFGLIHGLGFSNYLRSLLGFEENIVKPLFAFNIGLELGQLVIVAISIITSTLLIRIFRIKHHDLKLALSGFIAGMALFLIKDSAIFG
jgi:hypothetical protein